MFASGVFFVNDISKFDASILREENFKSEG